MTLTAAHCDALRHQHTLLLNLASSPDATRASVDFACEDLSMLLIEYSEHLDPRPTAHDYPYIAILLDLIRVKAPEHAECIDSAIEPYLPATWPRALTKRS